MATMSAASATANTITPPSSSHGNGNQAPWDTAERLFAQNSQDKKFGGKPGFDRVPLTQNGNSTNIYEYGFEPLPPPRKKASNDNLSLSKGSKSWDRTRRDTDASAKAGFNTDDVFGVKGAGIGEKRSTGDLVAGEQDDSKWIHRDKLAKIESEELQAAGIILPKPRASSRPRRGRSEEKLNGSVKRNTSAAADDEIPRPRSRKTSISPENRVPEERMPDLEVSSWDLRRPEEIAVEGDGNYWTSNGERKGVSKIPVAKASPAPIPESYIERNAPSARRQSGGPSELETTIAYPKPRPRSGSANTLGATPGLQPAKRSVTDTSPRKGSGSSSTAANRKASTQVKPTGKPKTRGGKDSTSSVTRPTTRSGDLSPGVKKPEGDPPWMVGTYKPDPRLPPDQQLLPTVARRLQQEQWEREGKFGSIYDKEFRPLTAEGLLKPPEAGPSNSSPDEEEKREHDEWPLRGDAPKSPTSPSIKQSASYSTMPKLSDKPQTSPLPSPRSPRSPMMPPAPQQPPQTQTVTRVPDEPSAAANMSMGGDKKKSGGGCGCCIVM
ncbi:hypothetical protein CMUS01_06395 [Colletotrichum musicola]|uniref:TeaA receptor TeaR n=1 Tax=Colletotrichum musicola TaxID=2175873 RepID=A0A8H6KM62_9PEZI|nr:hypothetical protein CMUS01_06395 [Colletotrichum musicola]